MHHLALHDADRAGAGREAAAIAHGKAARQEPRLARRIERVPDRLGRRPQVGIVRMAERLRDHGDHGALDAGALERVLERLLNHVSHPAGGARDQHPQGQGLDLVGGNLVACQLVAHLRAVAVHEDDVPPGRREIHDRRETRARVTELIADRRPLTRRRDGVASERDDNRPWRRHGGAT